MSHAMNGLGAALLCASAALADTRDKSRYTLFNPTPRERMRDLSTDRPDTTESPHTVDAGHVQVELTFADFTHDRAAGATTQTLSLAPLLVKVGLTNSIDVQLGLEPYTSIREEGGQTVDGFGDTTIRLKLNLCGNDPPGGAGGVGAGHLAIAVMPFLSIPTAAEGLGSGHVEGGFVVPLGLDLGGGWGLGAMGGFEFPRASGGGYTSDVIHTATIAHELSDQLGAFVEYAAFASLDGEEDYRAYLDAGLTVAPAADVQWDAGIRVGLTGAADDFGIFAGLSLRY